MKIKYGSITKKDNNAGEYILYPKSNSKIIYHKNTTVHDALIEIANALLIIGNVDDKITDACTEIYNRILNIQNGEELEQFINYINTHSGIKYVSQLPEEVSDTDTYFIIND